MDKNLFDEILKNEFAYQLGHTPNADEWRTLTEYISDWLQIDLDKKRRPNLTDLEHAIKDALHDKFMQCNECGDYFLLSEMNDCGGYYCLTCRPYTDPDAMPGGWHDLQIERAEEGE